MYLDSAYIAKVYINESDSPQVRELVSHASWLVSSTWAISEVICVFHRHMREGAISPAQCREYARAFEKHVDSGVWNLIPVDKQLLKRVASLVAAAPARVMLRAGDAVHLTTARELGEPEIWTNDRRMLAAATYFGLTGRSI